MPACTILDSPEFQNHLRNTRNAGISITFQPQCLLMLNGLASFFFSSKDNLHYNYVTQNSPGFNMLQEFCKHYQHLNLRHFISPRRECLALNVSFLKPAKTRCTVLCSVLAHVGFWVLQCSLHKLSCLATGLFLST